MLVNICTSFGLYGPSFFPTGDGRDYEPSEYLKILGDLRDQFTVFSGISHPEIGGDHASEACFLTSAKHPTKGGFRNTVSMDYIAAQHVGGATRFPLLTLSTLDSSPLTYTPTGAGIPALGKPSDIFARMFLAGNAGDVERELERLKRGKSVLDRMADRFSQLQRNSSSHDKQQLEDYTEAVRDMERQLQADEAWVNRPKPTVDEPAPNENYPSPFVDRSDSIGRARVMLNLIRLALKTDSTRVVSLFIRGMDARIPGIHHLRMSVYAYQTDNFRRLLDQNLSVSELVAPRKMLVNERLAAHYGIPNVHGFELQEVEIPAESPFGGVWTQASTMKVTANGTQTSPVKRGVWVAERLLGTPIPPPPPNIEPVNPDTRGAKTLREQLALHSSQGSCQACHAKFDPYGFALESFDVTGAFRKHYREVNPDFAKLSPAEQQSNVRWRDGLPVDCSGQTPDGTLFANIEALRASLAKHPKQLAQGVPRHLVTYATGTPVSPVDQIAINEISVPRVRSGDPGLMAGIPSG